MVSDETTAGHEILKPQTENETEDLTIQKLSLVYFVNQPTQNFLAILVSDLIYFDEVVQKSNKCQWHLSMHTEVSSLRGPGLNSLK